MYVNQKYYQTPQVEVTQKKARGKLTLQLDEIMNLTRWLQNSGLGVALVQTRVRLSREFILVTRSRRSPPSTCGNPLPPLYRQCALCYTTDWGGIRAGVTQMTSRDWQTDGKN